MYPESAPIMQPDEMNIDFACANPLYLVCIAAANPPETKEAGILGLPTINSSGMSSKVMYRPNFDQCRAYLLRNLE